MPSSATWSATSRVNVLTNYFNRAFDVEVDFPLVEPHQHVTAG